jgi:LPS-assembly protein
MNKKLHRLAIAVAAISAAQPLMTSAANTVQTAAEKDWVPADQLTQPQKDNLPGFCSGRYIEPDRPGKGDIANKNTPLYAEADEAEYRDGNVGSLMGNVRMYQGDRAFRANRVTFDEKQSTVTAEGAVEARQSNLLLLGDRARYNTETGAMDIHNPDYVAHDMSARGKASHITRIGENSIRIDDGTYTTCPPDDRTWSLKASEMELDRDSGFGLARHATLRMFNIPVLYTPYIEFPIDDRRKTGILYPNIGLSSDEGLDFMLPIYLNLRPDLDATLYPRIITERGFLAEAEGRYLLENGTGTLSAGWLYKDNFDDQNPFWEDDRWYLSFHHQNSRQHRWTFDIDFERASDYAYFDDFGVTAEGAEGGDVLDQRFVTYYRGGQEDHFWELTAEAGSKQNLNMGEDDPYEKLPGLDLSGWMYSQKYPVELNYQLNSTWFTRDKNFNYAGTLYVQDPANPNDPDQTIPEYLYDNARGPEYLDPLDRATGLRSFASLGMALPFRKPWGYFRPEVRVRALTYDLDRLGEQDFSDYQPPGYFQPPGSITRPGDLNETPDTFAPSFTLDSGLLFERQGSFFGRSYDQTLEPRVRYMYTAHDDHQEYNPIFDTVTRRFGYESLWADDRYSGWDRLGDANLVAYGVHTEVRRKGARRAYASIGQIYHLEDRRVLLDPWNSSDSYDENIEIGRARYLSDQKDTWSPIAARAGVTLGAYSDLIGEYVYDPNDGETDETFLTWRYREDNRNIATLQYRYSRSDTTRYKRAGDNDSELYECNDGSIAPTLPDCNGFGGAREVSNNIEAVSAGFMYGINDRWGLIGYSNFDLTNHRTTHITAGLEYSSCCWMTRLVFDRSLDRNVSIDVSGYENAIYLQFFLRGLGDLAGGSGDSLLKKRITGFGGTDY